MDKIKYLSFYLLTILFVSCNGMLDNIQKYMDEGETVYVGKLMAPSTNPGKYRIQLNGLLYYGVSQKSCLIEWKAPDGSVDSLRVPIEREEQTELFSVIIENLQEGQYDFTITTFDAEGNRSIPTTTQGTVYGDFYELSLMNRNISKIEAYRDQGFTVTWKALNEEDAVESEIFYETAEGIKSVKALITDDNTLLSGCLAGTEIRWRTKYLPSEDAIDSFYSSYSAASTPEDYIVELDKGLFREYILPTDARMDYWGFRLSRIWNGNTNWGDGNMCHSSESEGWPQWFTFDLGVLTKLDRYRYWQRLQEPYLYERADNPRIWELYGCAGTPPADGSWDGWIKLMDCESIKPSGVLDKSLTDEDIEYAKAGELFIFPEDIPAIRYLRWKTLETFSGKPVVHFHQVTFWGEVLD